MIYGFYWGISWLFEISLEKYIILRLKNERDEFRTFYLKRLGADIGDHVQLYSNDLETKESYLISLQKALTKLDRL